MRQAAKPTGSSLIPDSQSETVMTAFFNEWRVSLPQSIFDLPLTVNFLGLQGWLKPSVQLSINTFRLASVGRLHSLAGGELSHFPDWETTALLF